MANSTQLQQLGFTEPTIWREVTKVMGELEQLVWNDPLVTDDLTRAEGVRYLTLRDRRRAAEDHGTGGCQLPAVLPPAQHAHSLGPAGDRLPLSVGRGARR